MRKFGLFTAGAAALLCAASPAFAADCDADVVLVRGSSASQKLIEAVAKVAVGLPGQAVKIVYSKDGSSCAGGVYEAVTPVSDTTGRAATALMSYGADPSATCVFTAPRAADIGVSDVYPSSCQGLVSTTTLPAGVTDTLGPVQAFALAVYDDASFPVAISAEAAFNIFGVTGRNGDSSFGVSPWNVIADVYGRPESSGTWQTWARNLGLPTQKPVSTPKSGAGDVLAALNTANRASAIGIIALNDIVPTNGVAPKVRPLAFKSKGQDFAYYPNSNSTAADMINVRDGHYSIWANLHFLARKDHAGDYSANVKTVLGLLEAQQAVSAVAKIRAVPKCAMQVSRDADAGDFKAYKAEKPCGCFFEKEASGTAPAACKVCTDASAATDCGGDQQCVFGFCEAK